MTAKLNNSSDFSKVKELLEEILHPSSALAYYDTLMLAGISLSRDYPGNPSQYLERIETLRELFLSSYVTQIEGSLAMAEEKLKAQGIKLEKDKTLQLRIQTSNEK